MMLDEEVQKLCGAIVSVHDTGITVNNAATGHLEAGSLSLCVENLCGSFRVTIDHVSSTGNVMGHGSLRLGTLVEHRQFIGTHYLFHTIHGRLAYRIKQKTWNFKGARSLDDLVSFVRNLTQDTESPIYPVVNMLSVTLRTNTSLVIDPVNSLLHVVLQRLYGSVVKLQNRVDDTNNLFFMDVFNWNALLDVIKISPQSCSSLPEDKDVHYVRRHLAAVSTAQNPPPAASIGYTRNGVVFIRITYPGRGCVCSVVGSAGIIDGVVSTMPSTVCEGGIEPFVNVIVRFIIHVLVRIRALG